MLVGQPLPPKLWQPKASPDTAKSYLVESHYSRGVDLEDGRQVIFEKAITELFLEFKKKKKCITFQIRCVAWGPGRIKRQIHHQAHHHCEIVGLPDKGSKREDPVYKGPPVTLSADFSSATVEARKQCLKCWGHICPCRTLSTAKLAFKNECKL